MHGPAIDAHHHLWKYNQSDYVWMTEGMEVLRRDFLLPELEKVTHEAGIDGTVAVQARQMVEETNWLLELAHRDERIRGVVGWVPLVNEDARRHLERFAGDAKLKGVRHVLHDEPDDLYMLRKDFNRGVSILRDFGLKYDILVFERQLPQTLTFVDRHPNQIFIVDHLAKPRIREGSVSPWREQMQQLAKRMNVYCKVSGMVTEADWKSWTLDGLRRYFDIVSEAFGPKRLMFGSDWPVLTLASSYKTWAETFQGMIAGLSEDEQARMRGGTAVEAYGL